MNSQELEELKEFQSKLEEAKDNYLKFLLSKNYKIVIHRNYENSEVTVIHKDYLEKRLGYDCLKDNNPDWAEIIIFDLDSLLDSYEPYESTKPE